MAHMSPRLAAHAAVITLVSLSISGVALTAPAWADSVPDSTGSAATSAAPVDVIDNSKLSADWQVPDSSVNTKPRKLAASLDSNDAARVVSVRTVDGHPEIDSENVVGKSDAIDAIAQQQDQAGVLSVEVEQKEQMVPGADAPVTEKSISLPLNDPLASQQWSLSKLNAPAAWSMSQGAGQTVAVIDTGVAQVADLSGRLLTGWDIIANHADGRNDLNGHGTHVSGIIAADANNGVGIAGLAPQVSILPVRVLNASGSGWSSDIASGIIWAADHGATVINMSLGSDSPSNSMKSAINYAVGKGITVVAASGNDGDATPEYPAAYSNVIAVGATTSNDTVASFSTYGPQLDVAAPGDRILSTVPQGYASYSGTSMATPHVSAEAALIRSRASALGVASINVQGIIQDSAKDIGPAGWDKYSGYGRIDPVAALNLVSGAGASQGGTSESLKAAVTVKRKKIRVQLSRPVSKKVVLEHKVRGVWKKVVIKHTNAKGVTSFAIKSSWVYRIEIPGVRTTGALRARHA